MSIMRALAALLGLLWVLPVSAQDIINRDDLSVVFDQNDTLGTFVLLDVAQDQMILVGSERAEQRFFPASTFKVTNSLIALETGVIADENEIIPYGGKPQPIKAWEQDMSIRDGIRVSNVPVFQELARRIGPDAYLEYLEMLSYGNHDIGDNHDTFWLRGPLAISAIEQVELLDQLATQTLPITKRSQILVRDIMHFEDHGEITFFAKSGWTTSPDPDIGWFIGWIEKKGQVHVFALNIDMKGRDDAPKRLDIAKELLAQLGVY